MAVGCSVTSRSVCLPTTRISPSYTLRSIGSNRSGSLVKESIAGTIRMAILPLSVAGAGAGAAAGAVEVGGAGAGEDSARRRVPAWVVTTWTSRFMGEWPCLSRKVGVNGVGWLLSVARAVAVAAAADAVGAPPAPAPESPPVLGWFPQVAGIYRRQIA